MEFNFDEWVKLAEKDIEAFEKKRQEVLKKAQLHIARSDDDLRMLEGLQFKIDMLRRKHKTAVSSYMKLSEMLMDQLLEIENVGTLKPAPEQAQTGNIVSIGEWRKDDGKSEE